MSDPETGHLRTIVDTISDNAADAGIVIGGRAVRPDACDLRRVAAVLYLNEAIEETGVAAGVLGHPANGVAWLANKLSFHDEFLLAGQVILAGSFTRPVFVAGGDVIHADFAEWVRRPAGSVRASGCLAHSGSITWLQPPRNVVAHPRCYASSPG